MLYLHLAGVYINPVILFIASLAVGIAGGVFGNMANFVIVPILSILGLPPSISAGSGTGLYFGRASLSIFNLGGERLAFMRAAMTAGLAGLPGVLLGFKLHTLLLATSFGPAFLTLCYSVILLAGSIFVFRQWVYFNRNDYYDDNPFPSFGLGWKYPLAIPGGSGLNHITLPRVTAVGLVLGIAAGFLGLGAGMLGVPLYMYILGLPRENAMATDTITMAIIGCGAFLSFASSGRMEFLVALVLIIGVTLGFHIGSTLPGELNQSHARLAFSMALSIVALTCVINLLNPTLAGIIISAAGLTLCTFLTVYSMLSEESPVPEKKPFR